MGGLEHVIFWLLNALINKESKTYYTKIASYQRNKMLILSQPHGLEQECGGADDTDNNNNHNIHGVNVY